MARKRPAFFPNFDGLFLSFAVLNTDQHFMYFFRILMGSLNVVPLFGLDRGLMRRSNSTSPPPTPRVETPGIRTFKDWIVQVPSPSGQNGVQMPYPIVGFCLSNAPPKEQSYSVPVVCNKACAYSQYAETSMQDEKLF